MGNPSYSEDQAKLKQGIKSVTEEFTAWFNSVDFDNNEIAMGVLREIMADCTHRLQLLEEEEKG